MGWIWEDQNKYQRWLDVELAVTETLAQEGIIPRDAAAEIKTRAAFSVDRINEIEAEVKHDVIAFTQSVAEYVGPASRYFHFGLTSSDVLDTAMALQVAEASTIILEDIQRLLDVLKKRAQEFKTTVIVGRTHGIHAEPTTFGLKLALLYDEVGRQQGRFKEAVETMRVGKLSGAVGTFAHLSPDTEEKVMRKLNLKPAPAASQVIQRDRHAHYISSLALIANAREDCCRNKTPAADGSAGGRGILFGRAKGIVRNAAQTQPDHIRADSGAGACASQQCDGGHGERRTLA